MHFFRRVLEKYNYILGRDNFEFYFRPICAHHRKINNMLQLKVYIVTGLTITCLVFLDVSLCLCLLWCSSCPPLSYLMILSVFVLCHDFLSSWLILCLFILLWYYSVLLVFCEMADRSKDGRFLLDVLISIHPGLINDSVVWFQVLSSSPVFCLV